MKTGLVLEGGAMRGMFTAGVLDVLMENGITVDGAIGGEAVLHQDIQNACGEHPPHGTAL